MAETFDLEIATPDRLVLKERVVTGMRQGLVARAVGAVEIR